MKRRRLLVLSILYGMLLAFMGGLVRFAGDAWWPATILLFAPRWLVAVPLVVLIPWTLWSHPRWAVVWLAPAAWILFPICSFNLPHGGDSKGPDGSSMQLRVITCNVGGGELDVEGLSQLIQDFGADVVGLQECPTGLPERLFANTGWNVKQYRHLAIASRFPMEHSELLVENPDDYDSAVLMVASFRFTQSAEAHSSSDEGFMGPFCFACIHLPTPRPGFVEAWDKKAWLGEPIERVNVLRKRYANIAREELSKIADPLIVAGDFNAPSESKLFDQGWNRFANAFREVGWGFGWTKWTRFYGIRIDHVLHDSNWRADHAEVGASLGGDHRPLLVVLEARP